MLRRLLDLNHQRYAEEVAQGMHADATLHASHRTARSSRSANANGAQQTSLDFEAGAAAVKRANPTVEILGFLCAHDGWHAKADVLGATGIADGQWNIAIAELIAGGKVARQGERRGARYRAVAAGGAAQ